MRWELWRLRMHILARALVLPGLSRRMAMSRLLAWSTPERVHPLYARLTEQQIAAEVQRRLRAPWRMRGRRCLREGLLTFYFLRAAGIPAVLQFGVFHEARGREHAHCWVEVESREVTAPPQAPYVLIWTHNPASSATAAPLSRAA